MSSSLSAHFWERESTKQIHFPGSIGDGGWGNPPVYKSLVGRECPLVATNWEWLWTSLAQPRTKQSLTQPSHRFSDRAFGFGLFFSLCEENK